MNLLPLLRLSEHWCPLTAPFLLGVDVVPCSPPTKIWVKSRRATFEMNRAALTGCITSSPPSVHPPNKEQEFLGHFLVLHLAAKLAGPATRHLWNGSVGVYGNTQQRDFIPPVDCVFRLGSPTPASRAAGVMRNSHFLAAGSRGTEMSILIRKEWGMTFPGCTLRCWAQQQRDGFPLWLKNANLWTAWQVAEL